MTCAVVLAHEGGNGNSKGLKYHPVKTIQLSIGGPGGGCIGAKAVDIGLDDEIGHGVEHGLQARRQPYVDGLLQHIFFKLDVFEN